MFCACTHDFYTCGLASLFVPLTNVLCVQMRRAGGNGSTGNAASAPPMAGMNPMMMGMMGQVHPLCPPAQCHMELAGALRVKTAWQTHAGQQP